MGLQWFSFISRLVTRLSTIPLTTNTQNIQSTSLSTYALNTQTTAQQMFKQHWYEELNRQSKLSFYRTAKSEFRPEDYFTLAWGSRRALAKIRMSAHPLAIETAVGTRVTRTCTTDAASCVLVITSISSDISPSSTL